MKLARIEIDATVEAAIIALLNARLADALDLALMTKQAHWNIRGPGFIAVHEMLDDLRAGLDEHIDNIAERIAQLDGTSLGTSQKIVAASKLMEYPVNIAKITDHLEALEVRYAALSNVIRNDIESVDLEGDPDSADILISFSRMLDKAVWFLRAHFE